MMKWTLRPAQKIPKQFEKFRLNPITAQLLLARNIKNIQEIEKFFAGKYEDLLSPLDLSGMKEAVERIGKARKKNEIITIFGDYDADGLTSSALLKEALEKMGFAPPAVYIPDRNKEGYGLNKAAIDFIRSNYNPALIITVDCGISNWEEVAYAQKIGIEVVVTDHHSIPKKLPANCIIINPKLSGQKYSFPDLAGVGVTFKLVQACFEKFIPEKTEQLKWFLDLVAIGVPVVGPGKDERAGQARHPGLADMTGEETGLLRLAVPQRVHAQLAQQQRLIADEVLQPEQVTVERFAVVQVDVEGREVEGREVQVLGGRVAGVGDQAVRVGLPGHVPQLPEEALHAAGAVPAEDVRGNLVADAVR